MQTPPRSSAAAPRVKTLNVRRVPRAETLWQDIMCFASSEASQSVSGLADGQVLKAWKSAATAAYMQARSIQPAGYVHRRHHHILHQCADAERFQRIAAEVERRGLHLLYCLWIELGEH